MYRILVCDDEKEIVASLRICLTEEGYLVREAYTAPAALELIRREEIHLVLLGGTEPKCNCLQTMTAIRELSNVPVILLSSQGKEQDMVTCLNQGADDYITKPFHPAEVTARVNSQIRRYMQLGCGSIQPRQYTVGAVVLDDRSKLVTVEGRTVSLTPLEYDILSLLMKNPGRVFSQKEIYRIVWNEPPMGAENAVAVHIRHIREKIEIDPAAPRYLKVVWGKGYKMQAD